MKDSDWRILYELYQTPNITKVAEKLFMTQPTLTKRLQYIEEEFQTRIVSRSTKGVVFTREGEYLVHQAELYLQFRGGIDRRKEAFKQEGVGTIRIASSLTFSKQYLPALILEFQKNHPDVSFDIQSVESHFLAKFLKDGTSDMAFVRGEYEMELHTKRILTEQAYLVSSRPLSMAELLTVCRVDCFMSEASKKLLDRWWKDNFQEIPKSGVHVGFVDMALHMVCQGLGYMVGFFSEKELDQLGIWHQPILNRDGTPVERDTFLIYPENAEKSPIVQDFIAMVEKEFEE